MKIDDIKDWWRFVPESNLVDGCELKCPECGEWNCHKDWKESSVYCDDCGEHMAIQCPNCYENFDHVFSETFECRL